VFLAEVYAAREQPIPGVTSRLVGDAIASNGGRLSWIGSRTDLAGALAAEVKRGDVVVTIGAGDITRTGPELLQRLAE
jgi:UDP-N-acetylmuramate--alanine ligase